MDSKLLGKIACLTLLLILLLVSSCSDAQQSAQQGWTRTYGGTGWEEASSVQQTSDGGYIITGHTTSFGAGFMDVYLIKTDAGGDTLWTRTYGGPDNDGSYSVQQTSDGGYIIAGATYSFGAGDYDVYLIKTDASGDTLWTRTYGGTDYDIGFSVQQTSDGGYIIAGAANPLGAGESNVYLIKTDAGGDTLWTRTYGETDYAIGASVQQTSDGGYIIAGSASPFGVLESDVYLIKTDAGGDTLWTKTYGGTDHDAAFSVQQTSDGGYIIVGQTFSLIAGFLPQDDVYLIKTDANGDTLWTRTYGGMGSDSGASVQQTTDGGYIIAGRTEHIVAAILEFIRGGIDFDVVNYNVLLIKTDASGDTLWTRKYGGAILDEAVSVQQTSDGGYIIAGATNSFGAGDGDFYLIKTDAEGGVGGR
ncbi:MAG: hypothetical protein KJ606_03505 [Chloroflexi bacterium]|nr:hypothetical protein [Chloroflexota bacterium]